MNDRERPTFSDYGDRELLDLVRLRLVSQAEIPRWNVLMSSYHYLGFNGMIGERLRYVATVDDNWIALLGWHAAALKCGVRDRWIGWHPEVRYGRLRLIANNTRFLMLPARRIPNLASRILGAVRRRLSADWQSAYGHPVVLAETFVDVRFQGTCYHAAGWLQIGMSRGWGRTGHGYRRHGSEKRVFVVPLRPDARDALRDPTRFPDLACAQGVRTMTTAVLGSLYDCLKTLPEHRKARGIRHRLPSIYAIAVGALLCGARSYVAIAEWGHDLTQAQLRRVGARYHPTAKRYQAPAESTIRRIISRTPPEDIDRAVSRWLSERTDDDCIAIDGKTMKNARREDGKAVHLLSAFLHHDGVVLAQQEVDKKTNEIKHVKPLLENVELTGKVVTADALHTQKTTATFLVDEKKADYLFIVKKNQETLYKDIADLADEAFSPCDDHGRQGPRQA